MSKPRKTKAEKAADALASRLCAFALADTGAVINILDTVKLHRAAYDVALAGGDEAAVEAAARVWIAANRTNKPTGAP